MNAMVSSVSILGLLIVGGGILMMILFWAEQLPPLPHLAARIYEELMKAFRNILKGFDQGANDAGRSLGGIYGKPAAQALTPDNQVAELYEPAVLQEKPRFFRRGAKRAFLARATGIAAAIVVMAMIYALSKDGSEIFWPWYVIIGVTVTVVVSWIVGKSGLLRR